MERVFQLVESDLPMRRNNKVIKIVIVIAALVFIIPAMLFFLGARNYAAYIAITSLFGTPIIALSSAAQIRLEGHIKTSPKVLLYGRIFFLLTSIIGLIMMLLDRNGAWGPTFYQVTASIFVISSTVALIITKKK